MVDERNDLNTRQEGVDLKKQWRFVSFKSFVAIFSLCIMIVGVTGSYIEGVIVQIEKQFALSSTDVGFFTSSNFYTNIVVILFLALLSKDWNHPRVIAIGGFLYSLACFVMILPHIIYGTEDFFAREIKNGSDFSRCYPDRPEEECGSEDGKGGNVGPMVFLIASSLLRGIGDAPFHPLGLSYAYVNADTPKQAAFAVGVIATAQSVGGVFGNGLSAIFTTIPVNLQRTDYKPGDPQWLGAWWIGLLVQSVAFILVCTPLLFFPKTLKPRPQDDVDKPKVSKRDISETADERKSCFTRFCELDGMRMLVGTIKTFPALLVMLIVWITRFRSGGFGKFFVKIMTVNFRQPVYVVNILSAVLWGISAFGYFLMGVITAKLNDTRKVAYFLALTTISVTAIATVQIFLGCGPTPMEGVLQGGSLNLTLPCNSHCNCKADTFTPVCGADGKNFFSPCHAGCSFSNLTECACQPDTPLTAGWCESTCQTLIPFVITSVLDSLVNGLNPAMVLQLRLLKDEHKAFGMAFNSFMSNLVGGIPAPILFGAIVDGTCLVWRDLGCGRKGSCWLYDNEPFWVRSHTAAAAFLLCTVVLVVFLVYIIRKAKNPADVTKDVGINNTAYINETFANQGKEMDELADGEASYNTTNIIDNLMDSHGVQGQEHKDGKIASNKMTVKGHVDHPVTITSHLKTDNCSV